MHEINKAFFAPKKPEPKPQYSQKDINWAISFLNTPSQFSQNLPSDYHRELKRQSQKLREKSGKDVPQLGLQKNQSVPPLIVTSDIDKEFRAAMDIDMELMDPRALAAAKEQGITVMEAKATATQCGMSLGAFLGYEVADTTPARNFVQGKSLVTVEEYKELPTHMRNLHKWYMHIKKNKEYFAAQVREEHCFKNYSVNIQMDELFQLFNMRALDKSIISCYCL